MNKTKIRIFFNVDLIKHIYGPFSWTIGYLFNSCSELEQIMLCANSDRTRYKIQYE